MSERIFSNRQKLSVSVSQFVGNLLQRNRSSASGNSPDGAPSHDTAMGPANSLALDTVFDAPGSDFTKVPVHSGKDGASGAVGFLKHAASDSASPLEPTFRRGLEQHLGHDLSSVRIHQGPATDRAADHLGARAYTLGNSIYLGSEALSLSSSERARLLAHEAVHTVQQGGATVAPQAGLAVSSPHDAAEREAEQIAATFDTPSTAPASQSLALRDSMLANSGRPSIARMVAPQLQRDLTGKKPVKDGEFDLNLKTESHAGGTNGMSGTIKFLASDKAPDSSNIRLLQVVRDEDLTTGKDYVWTGGEANRNKAMTTASKGVDPGYFVDASYAGITPRTKKADARVSPFYRDYWPNATKSQDGSKKGKTVKDASLWDSPGSSGNRRFTFETAAKGADTGYVYATLTWGFTISDASKGKVEMEHADAHRGPSATFGAAVKSFNELFKNPGSSTAP
jgi:hypothetical protein